MIARPDRVPLQYVDVPIATSEGQARDYLAELATTPLPAVVINGMGVSVHQMLIRIGRLLPNGLTIPPDARHIPFTRNKADIYAPPDFGLHVDNGPVPATRPNIAVNFNFTDDGVAGWKLLRFTPQVLANGHTKVSLSKLCAAAQGDLNRGLVDPELFVPICYQATIEPDQTLVFREGEPLAHDVVTQTIERRSTAVIGSLMITEGLGITTAPPAQHQ